MGKSKFDFEIEEFEKAFSQYRDKNIAIYGTGRMTATLVAGICGYNIIGLCDRDENLIGQKIYGKIVLSRKEVEEKADILVINTQSTYWNTIFRRIHEWNIPIYYRSGEPAQLEENEEEGNPYWNSSYNELIEKIESHDIISFDIFDTLLQRRVMSPIDVFRIVQEQLNMQWGGDTEFVYPRKQAAASLYNPTLDEIYHKLQQITGWDDEKIEYAKECEIATDKTLIVGRTEIVELCNKVAKQKKVYLVSDMYYSARTIREMLSQVGLQVSEDQLVISCEHKKSKADGTLWEWYADHIVKGGQAIHIGDNETSDCALAEKYGIDSFYVMSASKMLECSSLKAIATEAVSIQASMAMGCICAKLCNSPFYLNKTKGKISFKNEKDAGYCLLGNLVYNFMFWLIEAAKQNQIEQIVFFAREGYLLIKQYRYICNLIADKTLPEAIYLEISRRAIWGAAIETKQDFFEIAKFSYTGNVQDFLEERFGLKIKEEKLEKILCSEIQADKEKFHHTLEPYVEKVLTGLKEEKANYLCYLEQINLKKKIAVVDSLLYGSTQYYFEKLIKKKTKGYYFCVCLDERNQYLPNNDMKGCFQKAEDKTGKNTGIWKNANFIESFFTSPNGMLIHMDKKGKPVYGEKMSNQQYFDERIQMQEGIFEFLDELIDTEKKLNLDNRNLRDEVFADKLFAYLMDGGFEPSECMKKSFYYDNAMLNHTECPIWE